MRKRLTALAAVMLCCLTLSARETCPGRQAVFLRSFSCSYPEKGVLSGFQTVDKKLFSPERGGE
mgnify:CR=1 FL=1